MEYSGSGEVWARVVCSKPRPKIIRGDRNNGSGRGVAGAGERAVVVVVGVVEAEAESNCPCLFV